MAESLDRAAHLHPLGIWRLRLRLSAYGTVETDCEPLLQSGDTPMRFVISDEPVDRNDRTLYHKLSDRSKYSKRKARHPGVYDVLLQNEQCELTEFSTGNLLLEIDGVRVTPPLDCGLLPGVLRDELLERREISERVLLLRDLLHATRIWVINSLRGLVELEFTIPT